MLTPEEIQAILAFLARVQIQGQEAPTLVRVVQKLQLLEGGAGGGAPVISPEKAAGIAASQRAAREKDTTRRANKRTAQKK